MKAKLLFSILFTLSWNSVDQNWMTEKQDGYNLLYTSNDYQNKEEYVSFIENGITSVNLFFNSSYTNTFNIYIHPNRQSLDSSWRKDWNIPDFKSECWMVASGVADKLDIISPKTWDTQSCEHRYGETNKTQQLITHELIHVFHGQINVSPDFSNTDGIDWFVEGLATFASGQCDSLRIAEVKQAFADKTIPENLADFWTGKLKYGQSGSMVMYIDHKYGRNKLKELLPLNKKPDLLSTLHTTESELLTGWKNYLQNQ